jgi:hypothetical protein
MSATLDNKLRELAARGELTYLSICPRAGGFAAVYSPASKWGHGSGSDSDPVEACIKAIDAVKLPKLRSKAALPPVEEDWAK